MMNFILRQIIAIFLIIGFMGCGSGGDQPFVSVPIEDPAGTVLQGFVANASLNGLYNSISVSYSPVASPGLLVPRVFNTDVKFLESGFDFQVPSPELFITDPIRLIDYQFPYNNSGLGQLIVETAPGVQSLVPFATEPAGTLAVFGINSTQISSPVLGIQLKALPSARQSLSRDDFSGRWGFISMSYDGITTAAELILDQGNASGMGFHSSTNSNVSSSLLATQIVTYGINRNGDKLLFGGSTLYVDTEKNVAMTAQAKAGGSDRISLLFRSPAESGYIINGKFDVFQWQVNSVNSLPALTMSTPPALLSSEVIRLGVIDFSDGTASMTDILGVSQQNVPYDLFPGSSAMWFFPALEQNFNDLVRLRIMLSHDQKLFFGVDYANDKDARTVMMVGVRRSLACTDVEFCP